MTGDIKNNIEVLEYPKVEVFEKITKEEIIKYISKNISIRNKYIQDLDYYIGKNTEINSKKVIDKDNPDSRISVSYARTMTQIVKGYMYKQGLITYTSGNEQYMQILQDIFDVNNEELVTSELGESQSKYGIGVELLYSQEVEGKAIPSFIGIKPEECIFIYNMDVNPKLVGCIRYYVIEEKEEERVKIYRVEVYFNDRVELYTMREDSYQKEITEDIGIFPNYFGEVPFCLYKNNQEHHADYQSVKPLIDAYDVLMSDSINELNRFASAYLLLKNFILSNSNDTYEKAKELERMKTKRVIELMEDGDVTFLTKDIPSEFFEIVKRTLREDIEYHSHVPDFRGKNFEAKSGVAMQWGLFDFENLCGDKQALFEVGLQRRIKLINNFLGIKAIATDKVDIKFERNLPIDSQNIINSIVQLKSVGLLADEDLLHMLPSDLIPDIEKAIENLKKQKEENMATMPFDLDQVSDIEETKNEE